ncbi:hypothetical protein PIIN_10673, partial [Serendipita indica DSM 11827]
FGEAEKMGRDVLALWLEVSGLRHPDTLNATYNLSHTLYLQRRFEEALQLLEGTIELRREILGEHHRHTQWAIQLLGKIKSAQSSHGFRLVKTPLKAWRTEHDNQEYWIQYQHLVSKLMKGHTLNESTADPSVRLPTDMTLNLIRQRLQITPLGCTENTGVRQTARPTSSVSWSCALSIASSNNGHAMRELTSKHSEEGSWTQPPPMPERA